MAEWKGQSRGTPIGYRIFIFLIRTFGLRAAYGLLVFVAGWFFVFDPQKSNRVMFQYFHERIGFSKFKSWWKIYTNYRLIGQILIDKVAVMSGLSDKIKFTSHGAEYFKAMLQEQRGGFLLGAHLGNWEIAGHFLAGYGDAVNIVLYDGEHQQIKEQLERATGGKQFNVIPIKNDLSHVYAINEALQRNEIICMHADRFLPGNRTQTVSFLGKEAQFPTGPFQLIKSLRAPYTFVYGLKSAATHYDFYARPHRIATNETKVDDILKEYVADLEKMVQQAPEQWFNYYDFWAEKK